MTDAQQREYWRVGYHTDPAGFVPKELCAWNHRFGRGGRAVSLEPDGNARVALFEGRDALEIIGDAVALTDPAPRALRKVCTGWHLEMEPAPGP